MAERPKAPAWKAGIWATVSGVQIPLSPPFKILIFHDKIEYTKKNGTKMEHPKGFSVFEVLEMGYFCIFYQVGLGPVIPRGTRDRRLSSPSFKWRMKNFRHLEPSVVERSHSWFIRGLEKDLRYNRGMKNLFYLLLVVFSPVASALPDAIHCKIGKIIVGDERNAGGKVLAQKNISNKNLTTELTIFNLHTKFPKAKGSAILSPNKESQLSVLSRTSEDEMLNYKTYWFDIHEMSFRFILEIVETKENKIEIFIHTLSSNIPSDYRNKVASSISPDFETFGVCE